MFGIGHQRMTVQVVLEHLFADRDGFLLGLLTKPEVIERGLAAFHDERRGVIVKLVGVHPQPAFVGLLEYEGKGVIKFLMRAQPDELAFAHVDVGFERVLKFKPCF